jgi:hypothetical protein
MEKLTVKKVYARSKRLEILYFWNQYIPIKSTTYSFPLWLYEISHRFRASVHNCAFLVENLTAVQQNLDAILEENS